MAGTSESRVLPSRRMEDHLPHPGPSYSNRLRTPSNNATSAAAAARPSTAASEDPSNLPSSERRSTPSSSRQLPNTHQDADLYAVYANPSSSSSSMTAAIVSPPRYATRGSLGSVAFSPGKSPGSSAARTASYRPGVTTTTISNEENYHSQLPYQNEASSSPFNAPSQQRQGTNTSMNASTTTGQYSSQQYEYYADHHHQQYHHGSGKPLDVNDGIDMSPEIQDLEARLADIAPSTPNHSTSLQEQAYATGAASSLSSTSSSRKRGAPTPLDLSPPRPAWQRSQERHPAIQNTSSPYGTSTSTRLRTSSAVPSPSNTANMSSGHANESITSTGNVSNNSSSTRQPYTGLGLGLPFSHSDTTDSLASLASSSSSGNDPPHTYAGKLASPLLTANNSSNMYPSPPSTSFGQASSSFISPTNATMSANYNQIRRQRSASDVLLSSPEEQEEDRSPIVDRRGLVGLGELSTPRWTAAVHERRWNHHHHHHNQPTTPRLPLHQEEENQDGEERRGDRQNEVESSEGGWEASVLGNYMDEKENDAYATYRKSMPAVDSYRSFSDVTTAGTTGTTTTTTGGGGQMSTSSSAYSLGALSLPESSSSSSSSEAGAFYTPSLRPNNAVQQDPLANYQIPGTLSGGYGHNNDRQDYGDNDTFKVPKDRNGNELLDSSTSTVLSPTSNLRTGNYATTGTAGGNSSSSRTSSRSTTSTSVQSSSKKPALQHREKEKDVPSYMRGTAASANKRTSVTSIDDIQRKQDMLASPPYQDDYNRNMNNNKTRHSSPPQQQLRSTPARTPAGSRYESAATSSRQSGHSRQSSLISDSGGKKHVPAPINTNRDALPNGPQHAKNSEARQPSSATRNSKSPSAIAHHILQQTLQQGLQDASLLATTASGSAKQYEEFDISAYAASNHATAEALSKLDGTSNASSPRVSRAYSTSSFKSNHTGGHDSASTTTAPAGGAAPFHDTPKRNQGASGLSRQNSKASTRTTSPHSRPTSSSRKSWAAAKGTSAPSPGLPLPSRDSTDAPPPSTLLRRKSEDQATLAQTQTLQPPVKSPLRASSMLPMSAPNSAIQHVQGDTFAKSPASGSNLSPVVSFNQPFTSSIPSRRSSGNRPSSSSGGEVGHTPSLSSKRSSSASLAFGTSTTGSRDSTSATSISVYGSPAQGKVIKSRRGSTSSDVSSVHSGVDGPNKPDRSMGGDSNEAEQAFARLIPPVPPLPKDWESYRPPTGGDSSVPTSASTSSFREKDASRISAMQALGVSDHRPGQQGNVSRSSSMEKPAGPRPLRDASSSSLSPAAVSSPTLASTSSFSSPAAPPSASSTGAVERQHNASKTPTKPKWSLSNAFGMSKSPTLPSSSSQTSSLSSFSSSSLEKSTSFSDLSSANKKSKSSINRMSLMSNNDGQSDMSRRKLASVPDIKSLAASSAYPAPEIKLQGLPHSASAHQIGNSRARTDSQSSASTANATGRSDGYHGLPTSPGRSLSSILSSSRKESSSRQTPSGIPFWSRRPSASHNPPATPSLPGSRKTSSSGEGLGVPSTPAQGDEKTGRRSILGINLFGRSSARKSLTINKDNLPPSPGLPQQYAASNRASTATKIVKHDDKVSELGVRESQESKRSSVGARASSLISGRKRGKTLPSNAENPVKPEPVKLPPMQMNALPPSKSSGEGGRVEEKQSSDNGTPQKRPLPVPPRFHRPSRVGDSLHGKDPLSTITGSPSVAVNTPAESSTEVSGYASKPATPTRIPRLTGSRSNVSSPHYLEAPATPGIDLRENGSDGTYRRNSLKPGSGISSSVPEQNSSYLKAERDEASTSSGSSSQETPALLEDNDVKPVDQPRRRVLGSSTSQVPVLSSSRTSGKYQAPAVPAASEKRRSLLLSEKEDYKPMKSPLRVSQPTASTDTSGKTQAASTTSSTLPSVGTTSSRIRTKTSEMPPAQRKSSTTTDGLPTSRSMGSTLASKLSIPTRMSKSATTSSLRQSPAPSDVGGRSTSSSRYGTPVGEDEIRGDEEMMEFVQRQRTKQASRGMSEEEIERLFTFPEPIEAMRSLSPQSALQLYRHEMCEYEMDEIMAYKEVFYVGRRDTKKMATKLDSTNNHGYDDERGDYQIIEGDHIQYRYEIIDTLGKGSFGQVLRCRDHSTGDMVAVKIIRNKKRFHHQALVEIKVLENLKKWDPEEKNCLLKIGEHFTFRGHLCITTELLGINLYELIKANSFRGFSTTLIRRFTVQILAALSLLRHHRVVHCDLKPENILLKHPAKSAVKVIDFGSSCFENEKVYTYIQSRFYRSPEVILGMNYHMAIDMWSLGCILAELYTGMPIFPGENEASQLACIMEVLGVPDKHIVDRSSRKKLFFDSTGAPRPTVDSKGRRRRPGAKTLQAVLKCDDELFVDFIAKCLTWDPDRRLKPGPALRHPFCAKGRSVASAPIPPRFSTASSRSLLRSTNISTPRRLEKKPSDSASVYSTPSTRHDNSVPSTAPVQRIRTVSAAVPSSVGPAYNSYRSYAK